MKVAVTGGGGQLGTVLIRRLAVRRNVESIVSIDVRAPLVASRKLTSLVMDVRDAGLEDALAGCDAVFHFAFIVTQATSRDVFWSVNVEGSRRVFEAARAAGVRSIVYASSVAAYGVVPGHPTPIVEDTPRHHQLAFPYAATKFEVEAFLDAFEAAHPEIAVTRLRPVILAGERMEHPLGDSLARGIVPDVGATALPFVWDEDVADAALLALDKQARGAFNLAAEDPLSPCELAAAAGMRCVPVPRALLRGAVRLSPWLARAGLGRPVDGSWIENATVPLAVSSERARSVLGWKPRYPRCGDVARRLGEVMHRRLDPRIAVFMRLAALGARYAPPAPEAARVRARIHLALGGVGGGDFTLDADEGRMAITRGAPRPPTSVIFVQASTFLDLCAGRLSSATAELTGKIRVEGDPIASMALSAMIHFFRERAAEPGARGWPARRLARWMGRAGAPVASRSEGVVR